jgi:hypothetical protein
MKNPFISFSQQNPCRGDAGSGSVYTFPSVLIASMNLPFVINSLILRQSFKGKEERPIS